MNTIKQLREDMGIDQAYLARKLLVSQPTVSNWESGKKAPSNKSALKLANFFGVSVDYILGREKEKKLANYGELDEDMIKISELVSSLDESRLDAALEIAQKISTLDDDEVKAILTVVRSMGRK